MANRSYIYGVKNKEHKSIGEYPYKIPYAYQVLAAHENRTAESELFDKKVAIKANFNQGKRALYFLLDFLAESKEMKDHDEFVGEVAKTKEFLDKIDADEILLENGEVYALYTRNGAYLDGEGLEKANEYEREDCQWIGEDIANLANFGIKPKDLFHIEDEKIQSLFKNMIDLKENWKENLGLDSWRSVLYFQFTAGE